MTIATMTAIDTAATTLETTTIPSLDALLTEEGHQLPWPIKRAIRQKINELEELLDFINHCAE